MTSRLFPFVMAGLFFATAAQAQVQTSGTTVVIPAHGEGTRAQDEGRAPLAGEGEDRDKAAAASRANQKMKQGVEILKREDPQARLQTRGYYTYAVYEELAPNVPQPRQRRIVGWRVGQYVDLTTTRLSTLPATVAAA